MSLLDTITYSNIIVGLVGAAMGYSASLMMGMKPEPVVLSSIFLTYFFIYNLNRKTDRLEDAINQPERTFFHKKHGKKLFTIGIISYITGLAIIIPKGLPTFMVSLIPLVCILVYSYKWVPKKWGLGFSRFKEAFLLKNLTASFSWSMSAVILTALYAGNPMSLTVFLVFMFIFMRVFINTIVFDIRDVEGDRKQKIKTLPVVIGIRKTKILLTTLNTLIGAIVLIYTLNGLLPPIAYFANISTLYTYFYLFLFGKIDNNILCDIMVDGEYILLAAFLTVGRFIVG